MKSKLVESQCGLSDGGVQVGGGIRSKEVEELIPDHNQIHHVISYTTSHDMELIELFNEGAEGLKVRHNYY